MSATRSIQESIELVASPEDVFDALIRPSAVRQWWNARQVIVHARPGGIWMATWGEDEDSPDYLCGYRMSRFERPEMLEFSEPVYESKSGPMPFSVDHMAVQFRIEPVDDRTRLSVTQDGFPTDTMADEYVAGCVAGWQTTLRQLKEFMEA
ncbi:MAG: SRPBCC family protein [Pirellulaceae bacterium]